MTDYSEYSQYLRQRSRLGLLYRSARLYPGLRKYVSGTLLDVGCGIGDFLKYYPESVGVDVNPDNVGWCRKQGLQVEQMDPDILPFNDDSFGTIMLDNVLEHISDPERILIEIQRVLVPSGVLIIGVPGMKGYASDSDHKVYYSKELLLSTVQSYGFIEEKVFGMPLNFDVLSKWLTQYCIYGVFRNGGAK